MRPCRKLLTTLNVVILSGLSSNTQPSRIRLCFSRFSCFIDGAIMSVCSPTSPVQVNETRPGGLIRTINPLRSLRLLRLLLPPLTTLTHVCFPPTCALEDVTTLSTTKEKNPKRIAGWNSSVVSRPQCSLAALPASAGVETRTDPGRESRWCLRSMQPGSGSTVWAKPELPACQPPVERGIPAAELLPPPSKVKTCTTHSTT